MRMAAASASSTRWRERPRPCLCFSSQASCKARRSALLGSPASRSCRPASRSSPSRKAGSSRRLWPTPCSRAPAPRVTRFATGTARRFSSSVLGYGLTASIVNACVFGTLHMMRHPVPLRQALRSHLPVATIGTTAALLSYVLILWVWTKAPIAIGAALRDTSVVFAALIAAWLGEGLSPRRAGAIALAAVGACLIRLRECAQPLSRPSTRRTRRPPRPAAPSETWRGEGDRRSSSARRR